MLSPNSTLNRNIGDPGVEPFDLAEAEQVGAEPFWKTSTIIP